MSGESRSLPSRAGPSRAESSRALPGRPSLRYLKLEAKRRLAAGEFATLHDAQAAIARELGLPNWAALKQACTQDSHAVAQLRWIVARFSGAGEPGWTPPGEQELREHFDDRFLAVIPAGDLAGAIAKMAADLRQEFRVISQAPLQAMVELAGLRYIAEVDPAPPHRLTGLRGFPLGERVTDPRVKAPPPVRTLQDPPDEIAAIAAGACAELGLAALVLAGGEPGREPWVVAAGHADLGGRDGADPDRAAPQPLEAGHRFPVPGVTALVTATAVLRLVADGRLTLDDPANDHLRAVRLADDAVTVRELLSHTGGVGNPAELYAESVPDLADVLGPVISCDGPRGTLRPSNGGYGVLGQLTADVTGLPYADAAARLVLGPLGMRDSRFPATAADIGPGAVTCYTATADGAFQPFPARVSALQAVAGLWSTGADLVRLGTGWASLLPAALAREALTPQTPRPGPGGYRAGLGWLLSPDPPDPPDPQTPRATGATGATKGAGPPCTAGAGWKPSRSSAPVSATCGPMSCSRAAGSPSSSSTAACSARGSPDNEENQTRERRKSMYQPYPGSTQLPETPRQPAPASVINAVRAMYAGAAASLIGIVIDILTVSATKTAIEKRSPNLSITQVNSAQHALIAGFIAGGVIAAAVWIGLALACRRGHNWARITGTVLFGLATLDTLVGLTAPVATAAKLWALVVWLAGLAAVVFLWRRDSSAYFKASAQ
jgi:CubicO group peptidase (beta-lactamase class C family)